MSFTSPYPGAIVVPADPRNYYGPGTGRAPCVPRAIVLHTPEEPADDRESTPFYFAGADRDASTRFYHDNDGDVYHLVPFPWGAIANGLEGRPNPYWATPGVSLNLQTDNTEIEGYAHSLKQTMTQRQWASLVDWAVWCFIFHDIPREEGRIMAHYELSIQRSDPGPWLLSPQSGFKQEVLFRVTKFEQDVKEIKAIIWNQGKQIVAFGGGFYDLARHVYGDDDPKTKDVKQRLDEIEKALRK